MRNRKLNVELYKSFVKVGPCNLSFSSFTPVPPAKVILTLTTFGFSFPETEDTLSAYAKPNLC